MERVLRIDGIYSGDTLKELNSFGISSFSFDFRPRSFNFLQQHSFMDIIEQNLKYSNEYFLRFANEQDFVINKFIYDLNDFLTTSGNMSLGKECFFLEFSGGEDHSFCNQFKMPYSWHFHPARDWKSHLSSDFMRGIVFPYSYLHELHEKGAFLDFVTRMLPEFLAMMSETKIKMALEIDWDSNIFPSIEEYFNFDFWSLPINSKIEHSFRNTDLQKVKNQLQYFQSDRL